LVDHYADRPHLITDIGSRFTDARSVDARSVEVRPAAARSDEVRPDVSAGTPDPARAAVTYVAGMTAGWAARPAVARLGVDPAKLPSGVDSWPVVRRRFLVLLAGGLSIGTSVFEAHPIPSTKCDIGSGSGV